MKCIGCGCTDDHACVLSCGWANTDPPVCDRCNSGTPFVAVRDESGQWEVVGPGPYGTDGVMVVVAGNELDAAHTAELLNQAAAVGGNIERRITARLAARQLADAGVMPDGGASPGYEDWFDQDDATPRLWRPGDP